MVNLTVKVEMNGPLFQPGADKMARQAMEGIIQELMEIGEQRLDEMLRPRPAGVYLSVQEAGKGRASKGNYQRNVSGKRESLNALITDGGVLYGPWLEGTGSRNQSTRFKGYSSFRRTAQWLETQVQKVLEAHVTRLIERLGG